jgi:hypothetical protein
MFTILWTSTACYRDSFIYLYLLVAYLADCSTLKREALNSSESPANLYQTRWNHKPEDSSLYYTVLEPEIQI